MINISLFKNKESFYNLLYKKFRSDIGMWESKYCFAGFIYFYYYSIRVGDTIVSEKTIFQKRKDKAKYLGCYETDIVINAKDLKEDYNNNKWNVPVNKKLTLQ
jgi:hypothetical protein